MFSDRKVHLDPATRPLIVRDIAVIVGGFSG